MDAHKKYTTQEASRLFWDFCSFGPKIKLFESVLYTDLVEIIGRDGYRSEQEIIEALKIDQKRGKKWLYLLSTVGLLVQSEQNNQTQPSYCLSEFIKTLSENTKNWWYYKHMLGCWSSVNIENFIDVLKGSPVKNVLRWPPADIGDSTSTELLMGASASIVIDFLKETNIFKETKTLLDVGGGDATMACALANNYPQLHVTVYNIEQAINRAKMKIALEKVHNQVSVHAGDFIKEDSLPSGFEMVLFSRVLCDWEESVCVKLLTMAYNALDDGGTLVICEPFKDNNQSLPLTWQYIYIFWDDLGNAVFKTTAQYQKILSSIGFSKMKVIENETGLCWALTATKERIREKNIPF